MAKRTTASPTPRKRATTKKANGAAPAPAAPRTPSDDDIRLRAYHRFIERGATPGGDLDDWLEAEKDLKASRS
jgi:hypothetical protein